MVIDPRAWTVGGNLEYVSYVLHSMTSLASTNTGTSLQSFVQTLFFALFSSARPQLSAKDSSTTPAARNFMVSTQCFGGIVTVRSNWKLTCGSVIRTVFDDQLIRIILL